MKLVLQRVNRGSVTVNGELIASIDKGLVILVGIGIQDDADCARFLAEKVASLRIFDDEYGKMNCSIRDIGGEALVVSQFTLYADTRKGRRPSFTNAALPDVAEPLVNLFIQNLIKLGIPTKDGQFGAHMLVEILNDGPVTILLEH
ncbi:MAG: D-aminoacyl-tRNA deacylase [Anaerolineales bacterium]